MAAFEIIALDPVVPQLRAPGAGDTYVSNLTFNNAGTTFTGWQFNVTDSASNAASLLADWRVGGVPHFTFQKDGGFFLGGPRNGAGFTFFEFRNSSHSFYFRREGIDTAVFIQTTGKRLTVGSDCQIGFSSSLGADASPDVSLWRDAANTLAQRNGTNAQTFRTYGTFTDTSNYRRVQLAMTTAGVATLRPEGAGTGASGNVLHISGLPTSNPGPGILWNNAGTPAIGT